MPNVNSKILSKVIEYCSFHVAAEKKDEHGKAAKSEDEVKAFDAEFTKVDQGVLFELILVSEPLKGCRTVVCGAQSVWFGPGGAGVQTPAVRCSAVRWRGASSQIGWRAAAAVAVPLPSPNCAHLSLTCCPTDCQLFEHQEPAGCVTCPTALTPPTCFLWCPSLLPRLALLSPAGGQLPEQKLPASCLTFLPSPVLPCRRPTT